MKRSKNYLAPLFLAACILDNMLLLIFLRLFRVYLRNRSDTCFSNLSTSRTTPNCSTLPPPNLAILILTPHRYVRNSQTNTRIYPMDVMFQFLIGTLQT